MKKKKTFLVAVLLSCICVLSLVMYGCGEKPEKKIIGEYWSEEVAGLPIPNYKLSMKAKNQYTMSIVLFGAEQPFSVGTYSLKGMNLELTVLGDAYSSFAGTYENEVITLSIEGLTLVFRKSKVTVATVLFDTDGGSTVQSQTMGVGGTAVRPPDPTKEGFSFAGWFKDEDKTQPFDFSQTIDSSITVYAKWELSGGEEPQATEYEVLFNLGYLTDSDAPEAQTTAGRKLTAVESPLREGYTFCGWWIGDLLGVNLFTKWTPEHVFYEDTVLFARWEQQPAAPKLFPALPSISGDEVRWNAVPGAVGYQLNVTGPAGFDEISRQMGADELTAVVPFGTSPAGSYAVSLYAVGDGIGTVSSQTRSVNYTNKQLIAPNRFKFASAQSKLSWEKVPNAESYDVSYCRADALIPKYVYLKTVTTNAAVIDGLPETANYLIQVTSRAEGYLPVSSIYIYIAPTLLPPAGFAFDFATNKLSWRAVPNAVSYKVSYSEGGEYKRIGEVNTPFIVLPDIFDVETYDIKVEACAQGFVSKSGTYSLNWMRLSAPRELRVVNGVLSWRAVDGADSYDIKIGDMETTVSLPSFTLDLLPITGSGEQEILVRAKNSEATALTSGWSAPFKIAKTGKPATVSYSDGVATWTYIIDASKYEVQLNGGEPQTVYENSAELPAFTDMGTKNIRVRAYNGSGYSDWAELDVTVYSVFFISEGGLIMPQFKATGDRITLPSSSRFGYDFTGWFTAPNGEGTAYTSDRFTGVDHLILYASFTAKSNDLAFDGNEAETGSVETKSNVKGGLSIFLPQNRYVKNGFKFAGWNTQADGGGTTYQPGEKYQMQVSETTVTLYAKWKSDGVVFERDGNAYIVTGYAGDDKEVRIPGTYLGLPVTGIADSAFSSCYYLTDITIPDSVTSIGSSAFRWCGELRSVTIPDSVTSIGSYAFNYCNSIESVFIGDGVTSIGDSAFTQCGSLESIVVSGKNTYYRSAGNCLIETNTKKLISGRNSSVIPKDGSVTIIGNSAFSESSGLVSIAIPDSVTSIEDSAFSGCRGLISISIGSGLTSIGDSVFSYCESLARITISDENTKYHSVGNCLIETETKILIAGCKNSVIPTDGSVTSIGKYAFNGRTSLLSITIPDGVVSIEEYAFNGCISLLSITIPDGVVSIGRSAFNGCRSLVRVTIPDSVTSIGNSAFSYCDRLESVFIGSGVASIENSAFSDCASLADIAVSNENARYHSAGNCLIETQSKTLILGCFNSVIPTDGSVTSIGENAFAGCLGLVSIIIPDSVTRIERSSFHGCSGLVSVTIGSGVATIGSSAFYYCTGLTSIIIPDSVTSIGSSAFYGCDGLTIYCQAESLPDGWQSDWNPNNRPVVWGHSLSARGTKDFD